MTNTCDILTCTTGSRKDKSKHSVFKVPNRAEIRKKWIDAIKNNTGQEISRDTFYVCEKHFEKSLVKKKKTVRNVAGEVIFEVCTE